MRKTTLICLLIFLFPIFIHAQWVSQATGFTTPFRGLFHIWAVNENIAWAIAYDGSSVGAVIQEFTRTTNGGTTWTPGNISGAADLQPTMIFALNADTAWITFHHSVTSGGRIMRTNDGGQNWVHQATAVFSDTADAYPNIVYFWNENEGFSMGDPTDGYFELYTTNNGGILWTRVDSINIPAIVSGEYGYEGRFSVIGNTIMFGTNKGRIYKSNDKGHSWTIITTPFAATNNRVRVLEFRDTLNGLIADRVNNAYILQSTSDGGANWQSISPNGVVYGNDLRYIKGTPATYVSSGSAAVLSGASISYDGGLNWSDISVVANTQYTALAFPNNITGWAGQFNQNATTGGIAKFVGSTVGVDVGQTGVNLSVFPNPSEGLFRINLPGNTKLADYEIYNSNGQLLPIKGSFAGADWKVDLRNYPPGLYFLRLFIAQDVLLVKLIKS